MDTVLNYNKPSTAETLIDYGLVSIIMPNYNSEKYVEETIKSVLAQTYQNWELIFVDDCSTDSSLDIVRSFGDDRIKIFQNEVNSGAAVARNKAIEAANGRWIAFLDSDDLWEQNKLATQLEFMIEEKCSFSFTHYYFDKNDSDLREFSPKRDEYDYNDILKHCYIACPTVIYDSSILGKVYMPTEAVKREDFGCWLRILKQNVNAHCLHKCLTTVKIHTDSVSYDKAKMIKYQWNVYRNVEKISIVKSIFCMVHWAIKGVLKYR